MNATAKQAYSFCGASPADREHEVRQMRSIWSGGGSSAGKFQKKLALPDKLFSLYLIFSSSSFSRLLPKNRKRSGLPHSLAEFALGFPHGKS